MNSRLIFKQICTLCANHEGGELSLCPACLADLPWHSAPQCPQCAIPTDGSICGSCLSATPYFDASYALFAYDYPLDRLLQHYKYQETLHLAHTFATLLSNQVAPKQHIDLIIPMPMHRTRIKERGFNQALEIARLVAKQNNIKLDYTSAIRTKYTPPQASLAFKDRIKNMRGAFNCHGNLQGFSIAIVDDVMTTGASLNELAKTLKQAGASHVECWVIARTLPKS
ncbi:MAG: ComF family protein [Methylotenera sp.]|nr:ComF family protein [Methylotenera sp.]